MRIHNDKEDHFISTGQSRFSVEEKKLAIDKNVDVIKKKLTTEQVLKIKIFKQLPKCCQNSNKIIIQNFQVHPKMLPEWQEQNFFKYFSKFLSTCHNDARMDTKQFLKRSLN